MSGAIPADIVPVAVVSALIGALTGGWVTHRFALSRDRAKVVATRKRYLSALATEIDYCARLASTYLTAGIKSPLYRFPTTAYETVYSMLLSDVLMESDLAALTMFYSQVEQMNRGLDAVDRYRVTKEGDLIRIELDRLKAKAAEMRHPAESHPQPGESDFYNAAIGAVRAHM
jgi:hypothetical protein